MSNSTNLSKRTTRAQKLGRIVGYDTIEESRSDLVLSDDSSFNRDATKYCRYVISRWGK